VEQTRNGAPHCGGDVLPGVKPALAKFPESISVVVGRGRPGGRALAAVASTVFCFKSSASLTASFQETWSLPDSLLFVINFAVAHVSMRVTTT
jgi:hypothetical protein